MFFYWMSLTFKPHQMISGLSLLVIVLNRALRSVLHWHTDGYLFSFSKMERTGGQGSCKAVAAP